MTVNIGGCSGDEATTMCGPGFDPRFYFFWPRATLHRQKRLIVPLMSQIYLCFHIAIHQKLNQYPVIQ